MTYSVGLQFFAVPAHAVADHGAQREAWLWYGDTFVPVDKGFFDVGDDGRLEFKADNDEDAPRDASLGDPAQ